MSRVLRQLRMRGLEVEPVDNRIRLRPAHLVTDRIREFVREHREEILRALRTTPGRCAQCGREERIMLVMEPGPDDEPWALCRRCY